MKTLKVLIFLIPLLSVGAPQPVLLYTIVTKQVNKGNKAIQNREKTVFETIAAHPELSTWASMLKPVGLDTTLGNSHLFTVFVPTNQAIKKLPASTMQYYLNTQHPEKLAATLKYHIVPGRMRLEDLKDGQKLRSLNGEDVTVVKMGNTVGINGVKIGQSTIGASNG